MSSPAWLAAIEADAPDVVAVWRVTDWSLAGLRRLRREVRSRVHEGDAARLLAQQAAIGAQLGRALDALPDELLRVPGGEGDWNVAQTFAHTTAARRFLAAWAALDCSEEPSGREPNVTPSVPGPADATRGELHVLLDKSSRALERAAAQIAGHELQRCRMRHPLIGHLRCGEWLCFVGVHDLMHLEQLHDLAKRYA